MIWLVRYAIVFLIAVFAVSNCYEDCSGCLRSERRSRQTRADVNIDRKMGRPLKIVTVEHEPHTYYDKETMKFEGFVPDMILRLSKRLNFKYEFYLSPDGTFGRNENGTWTGMMGELIKNQLNSSVGADLVASPMAITTAREEAVAFLKPFQHMGMTVVIKKPYMMKESINWPYDFGIFEPFAPEVWVVISMSVIVVGLLLWLMNKCNPYEWGARYEQGLATEQDAHSFTLSASLWFTFTTLQWQGYEKSPRCIAAKVLTCAWFAFVSLVLVTYTASLVNHLFWASTVHGQNPISPDVSSLEDLILSKDYTYGTVKNSQTYRYIMDVARGREFKYIRDYWATELGRQQLVNNHSDGFERARQGKYGFIVETMTAKHETNKIPCDLMVIGEPFGLRSYGIGLPKNSVMYAELNQEISEMLEEGDIEELEQKWWVDQGECWNVTRVEKLVAKVSALYLNQPKRVNLTMFMGPVVLIAVGVIISLAIAGAEILYYKHKGRYESSNRPKSQPLEEDVNM